MYSIVLVKSFLSFINVMRVDQASSRPEKYVWSLRIASNDCPVIGAQGEPYFKLSYLICTTVFIVKTSVSHEVVRTVGSMVVVSGTRWYLGKLQSCTNKFRYLTYLPPSTSTIQCCFLFFSYSIASNKIQKIMTLTLMKDSIST